MPNLRRCRLGQGEDTDLSDSSMPGTRLQRSRQAWNRVLRFVASSLFRPPLSPSQLLTCVIFFRSSGEGLPKRFFDCIGVRLKPSLFSSRTQTHRASSSLVSQDLSKDCDLLIVLGTSLKVQVRQFLPSFSSSRTSSKLTSFVVLSAALCLPHRPSETRHSSSSRQQGDRRRSRLPWSPERIRLRSASF